MKKKLIITLSILFVLILSVIIILVINRNKGPFFLEDNYYEESNITEIQTDELNQLVEDKKSFAVFIYQPMCITSSSFENILTDFLEENQISIYKISFSNIKDANLGKSIKYYPSFVIYNKGKIVDFLEANKDEDVEFYTSKEGFASWFTKYIKLKDKSSSKTKSSTDKSTESSEENNDIEKINLENVKKEENKVNIYFFWGDGCPHCEQEFEFFKSIEKDYGEYYNLYTFETWYNEENAKLSNIFANAMGDKITGVPYTIIGNKSFTGFGEQSKKDFINSIEEQSKSDYDIYFDKIKK